MLGDKIMDYETILGPDAYIREPFIWDVDKKDKMQTSWEVAKLSTDKTVVPFAKQKDDPNSLYSFYKKFIHYRNSSEPLTVGEIDYSPIAQQEVVSFIRTFNGQKVLAVHNVSDVEVTIKLEGDMVAFQKIDFASNTSATLEGGELKMPAFTSAVLK